MKKSIRALEVEMTSLLDRILDQGPTFQVTAHSMIYFRAHIRAILEGLIMEHHTIDQLHDGHLQQAITAAAGVPLICNL